MFVRAVREENRWLVSNSWGHQLALPCASDMSDLTIQIGTLGTGCRRKGVTQVTKLMSAMVAALPRHLYMLDVRRNGTGGQGSWSPKEFATIIRAERPAGTTYDFIHLPTLAPSLALLDQKHIPWRDFSARYTEELTHDAIGVARAFIEAAAVHGGLAVFICAEADQPNFDALSDNEQLLHYCHRFTLAHRVGAALKEAWPRAVVQLVQLDMVDFLDQKATERYQPRVSTL
jgi:hypothetical protein